MEETVAGTAQRWVRQSDEVARELLRQYPGERVVVCQCSILWFPGRAATVVGEVGNDN